MAAALRDGEDVAAQVPVGGQAQLLGDAGGQVRRDLFGGLYDLGGEGGAQVRVADDPQGIPAALDAAGELGVVCDHGIDAHHDGAEAAALGVDVAAGFLAGDPLGGPGVGGQLAVQGHGVFQHDVGAAGLDVMEKDIVEGFALGVQDALGHGDTVAA